MSRRVKSFKFKHDRQSQEFARRVVEALNRTIDRSETDTDNANDPCPNCGSPTCSAKGKGTCDYVED